MVFIKKKRKIMSNEGDTISFSIQNVIEKKMTSLMRLKKLALLYFIMEEMRFFLSQDFPFFLSLERLMLVVGENKLLSFRKTF